MGCFAFTPPSRMIASVMRGTDKSGRMFIAIRTKNKNPYKLNKMIKTNSGNVEQEIYEELKKMQTSK